MSATQVTPEDYLYSQQNPQALASKLSAKGVTVNDVFHLKQNPQAVASKLGLASLPDCEAGCIECANATNVALTSATE